MNSNDGIVGGFLLPDWLSSGGEVTLQSFLTVCAGAILAHTFDFGYMGS